MRHCAFAKNEDENQGGRAAGDALEILVIGAALHPSASSCPLCFGPSMACPPIMAGLSCSVPQVSDPFLRHWVSSRHHCKF